MAERAPASPGHPGPRRPSRTRGIARFNTLLDATERLLRDRSPTDVGLYQIAREARVPPASVYHFFPAKEAAFLALAQRYFDYFLAIREEPVDARALTSWQALLKHDQRRGMEFYNAHPPAMKILYGGYGTLEIRQADFQTTDRLAEGLYQRMNGAFHMPAIRNAGNIARIMLAIMDAIWALSFLREGRITEAYFEQGFEATIAYARLYLPERVELRDAVRKAAAAGTAIVVPEIPVA